MEKKKLIRNKAMEACKNYGYDWAMADYQFEDADELIKEFKEQMMNEGSVQTQIFNGEEPFYALGDDLYDVMEEGDVFSESEAYHWINLGRIDAWKEILGQPQVGYFSDGYGGYVFNPKMKNPEYLKNKGTVVLG